MPLEINEFAEYEIQDKAEESSSSSGFLLTSGDIDIFKLLYKFRFLRREHLSVLTGRSLKKMHGRLFKLVNAGYLTTIRLPQQKHIYGLAKRAQSVLVEQGSDNPELLSERVRIHELKELFLKHEMMIVDFHVILSLATRGSPFRLVDWREGTELFDSVFFTDHSGLTRLAVRPDAFFILEDSRRPEGQNRTPVFLEADRSSANHTRFKDKIRGYWHYLAQGLHTIKYGIEHFRVLTMTVSDARAQNLSTLASSTLPAQARKYFFFAAQSNVSLSDPTPILGEIYFSARSAETHERHSLIPPLKQPLQNELPGV
ncbi:MAG TPA: replication-relaxation family protein [Candidatus Saccharimonadales bacterium]|nr:replication-relaxation family protein [Candidatus Saccharimonadales bacterium]